MIRGASTAVVLLLFMYAMFTVASAAAAETPQSEVDAAEDAVLSNLTESQQNVTQDMTGPAENAIAKPIADTAFALGKWSTSMGFGFGASYPGIALFHYRTAPVLVLTGMGLYTYRLVK